MNMKRLMALIALASPAALAQTPSEGNIPAPGLFDSQILCSSQLPPMPPMPTNVPDGATASQLDTAIGMGSNVIVDDDVLDDLGFVIPPGGSNCGQGEGEDAFTVADQGTVAVDLAEGYSALLPKFMAAYGDPDNAADTGTAGALAQARATLERAEADETTSASRLSSLRAALTRAQEAHTAARAEFNAIASGEIDDATVNPVYAAAVAEWMAKTTVTQAIGDYNAAVLNTNRFQNSVDALSYAGYVPLGNSELIGNVIVDVGGVPTVNLARLREYANADGSNVATANADGVYNTSSSNFDAAGNLVAPNRLTDGELEAVSQSTAVARVRSTLDGREAALAALTQLQADNLNALLQPVIDEGVRRAQLEVDHYQMQLQNALADTTNQNPVSTDNPNTSVNEAAPFSIASRHADNVTASNSRVTAEAVLRAAVADRETATQNVIDQFSSPGSFYQQLVSRRTALQTAADKAVTDASEDGATPSKALTDAAVAAATALENAQATQASYLGLADDPDSPVLDLIDTLVATDGDDGQALVDAISQTWDNTVDNAEAIGALTAVDDPETEEDETGPITANTNAIEALSADTDEGAEADGPITANRKAIEANDGEIEALGGRVTQNETDIDTLQEDTDMNTGMIATNAGNITANAGNIAGNANNIVANSGRIGYNAGNIATNAGHIATNVGLIGQNAATLVQHGAFIDRNAGHIAFNSERIGANAAALTLHGGMISDNRHMIGELSSDLDMVRAGVAASIALSRMPSIDGGGISFGAGTFAGEFAYAVGFQRKLGLTSFDIGVTSSGGEIGAGVGVGVKFWD